MTCSLRLLVITILFGMLSCRPQRLEPEPTPRNPFPLRGTEFKRFFNFNEQGFIHYPLSLRFLLIYAVHDYQSYFHRGIH